MLGINRYNPFLSKSLNKQHIGEMSPEDKRKSVYGDKRQGDKLVNKKFATPSYHATHSMHMNGPPVVIHNSSVHPPTSPSKR